MIKLFPTASKDIAAAIEGQQWRERIERVDYWLEYCCAMCLSTYKSDPKHLTFASLHAAISTAFEHREWAMVDEIVNYLERVAK
jgi:hypothetical protein